jgi:RHS repeat-associated protein
MTAQATRTRRFSTPVLCAILVVTSLVTTATAVVTREPIDAQASTTPAAGWSTVTAADVNSSTNVLSSIYCLSTTVCWAAGYYTASKDQTLIEQYNGTSWSVVTSANNSSKPNYLTGITCISSTNCFAVGYYCNSTSGGCPHGNGPYDQTLIEQYNGTTWTIVTSPNTSTSKENVLNGVTCPASNKCYAVGYSCESTNQCTNGANVSDQTLIEKWDGSTWTIDTSANTGASSSNFLTSVTCVASTNCVAAGYYCNTTTNICPHNNGPYDQTLIEKWDGSTWAVVTSPNVSASEENLLNSVSCYSATECWAVGYYCPGTQCNGAGSPAAQTLIEAFDGNAWTITASPNTTTGQWNQLQSVDCFTGVDCVAVGYYCTSNICGGSHTQQTLAAQWDGTSWGDQPSPNPDSSVDELDAVTCGGGATSSNCLAVGFKASTAQTLSEQYGGAVQTVPNANSEWGSASATGDSSISGPDAPSNVNGAVNTSSGVLSRSATDASVPGRGLGLTMSRSFNGPQAQTGAAILTEPGRLYCVSGSDCWMIGYYCAQVAGVGDCTGGSYDQTLTEHYDGTSWKTVASPNVNAADNALTNVTCVSSSDCWAVGWYDNSGTHQTLTEHYDGTTWSIVTSANSSSSQVNELFSVNCVTTSDCWAVGRKIPSTVYQTMSEHWNGTAWSMVTTTNQNTTQNNYLYGVWCTSTSNCWASGYYYTGTYYQNLVEQYNGTSWSTKTAANTSTTLDNAQNRITCTSSSNCWTVGYAKDGSGYWQTLTTKYNGTSWSVVTSPTHSTTQHHYLYTVYCVTSSDCYAGGRYLNGSYYQTLVEHYNGTSWSIVTTANTSSGENNSSWGVSCASTSDCWAVGPYSATEKALVQHYNGTSWSIPSGTGIPTGGAPNEWVTPDSSIFGNGWVSNLTVKLTAGTGTETITDETGAPVVFSGSGTTWTAPMYNASTLAANTPSSGNWTYTRRNGEKFVFNSSGQLTSMADANGNTTSLSYTSGKLATVTDPGSRTLTVAFSGSTVSSIKDPANQYVYFYYDGSGDLVQVKDQANNSVYYTYDGNRDLLTEKDKLSNTTTYAYDANGRVTSQVAPGGVGGSSTRTTTYAYTTVSSTETTTLVTAPVGDEVQYTYDWGLMTKRVGAYGQSYAATSSYIYDPAMLGTYVETDSNGNKTYHAYNTGTDAISSSGTTKDLQTAKVLQTTTTDTVATTTIDHPRTVTDANGNVTTYAYDSNWNTCWSLSGTSSNSCTNVPTGATAYTYSNGEVLTSTDQDGNVTTSQYDSAGNLCWTVTGTVSSPTCGTVPTNATSYTYDSLGNKLTMVSIAGNASGCTGTCVTNNTTTYTYDGLNDLLTTQSPSPTGSGFVTVTNTYDVMGHLLTTQDAAGNYTTNTYDNAGETCWTLIAASASGNACTSAPSTATSSTYDDDGQTATSTDSKGNVTTYTYNQLGQKTAETQTSNGNEKTTYTLDANGNILTMVAPAGNVTGCTGACITNNTTTYTYDDQNRQLTVQDPNGHTTTNTYDGNGNLLTVTDAVGNVTTNAYDSNNRLCWTYVGISSNACGSPPSGATSKTYDTVGNVLTVTDGNGNVTTNTYDSNNRLCWTYLGTSSNACGSPPSGSTRYSYDTSGNVLTTTEPDGTVITNTYNSANQLCWSYVGTSSNACSSPPTGATSYTYDSNGHVLTMVDPNGTTTKTYDVQGRVCWSLRGTSANACSSRPSGAVGYAYDDNGNVKTLTYPDATIVSQAFDAANRTCWTYVGSSSAACGSPPSGSITYAYDDNSNLTSETLPNGVVNSYTYDHANMLATISDAHSGTTIFAANYTRNNDNLVTVDDSQPSTSQKYKYTSKNQLCYADSANTNSCGSGSPTYPYGYDNAGNVTNNKGGSQTYDTKNQLCWSLTTSSANACASPPTGATTYGFDSNGNRTSSVPSSGSATCYTYDSGRNTLATIKTGTGSSCTTPTTVGTYAYDGQGLRMSKTVGSTTTSFHWSDGGLPLMLDEQVGSAYTDYVFGPRGTALAQISGATTVYFSADNLGSTRAITNSSGTSIATYAYDPWGNVTSCTGTTVTVNGSNLCTGTVAVSNSLLFAGQYRDDETGLYYMRARYYDPTTAQFLTVDPQVASTLLPYEYTPGNPVNTSDPTGLDCRYGNAGTACVWYRSVGIPGFKGYQATVNMRAWAPLDWIYLVVAGVGGWPGGDGTFIWMHEALSVSVTGRFFAPGAHILVLSGLFSSLGRWGAIGPASAGVP